MHLCVAYDDGSVEVLCSKGIQHAANHFVRLPALLAPTPALERCEFFPSGYEEGQSQSYNKIIKIHIPIAALLFILMYKVFWRAQLAKVAS